MNEWKSVPRLISGRSGATATVKSKTGAMVVTGGFGFYNFVLNSSEILEKNKDLRKLKWTSGWSIIIPAQSEKWKIESHVNRRSQVLLNRVLTEPIINHPD